MHACSNCHITCVSPLLVHSQLRMTVESRSFPASDFSIPCLSPQACMHARTTESPMLHPRNKHTCTRERFLGFQLAPCYVLWLFSISYRSIIHVHCHLCHAAVGVSSGNAFAVLPCSPPCAPSPTYSFLCYCALNHAGYAACNPELPFGQIIPIRANFIGFPGRMGLVVRTVLLLHVMRLRIGPGPMLHPVPPRSVVKPALTPRRDALPLFVLAALTTCIIHCSGSGGRWQVSADTQAGD
jgi:hypothetical protein